MISLTRNPRGNYDVTTDRVEPEQPELLGFGRTKQEALEHAQSELSNDLDAVQDLLRQVREGEI